MLVRISCQPEESYLAKVLIRFMMYAFPGGRLAYRMEPNSRGKQVTYYAYQIQHREHNREHR